MDTSEKYIKMCETEEIQSRWEPVDGDFFVHRSDIRDICIHIKDSRFDITRAIDLSNWIWLPRQDQLQDILAPNVTLGYMIVGFDAFHDPERYCRYSDRPCRKCRNMGERRRATYDTMCQWYLAFVMHEKFDKEWGGSNWCD